MLRNGSESQQLATDRSESVLLHHSSRVLTTGNDPIIRVPGHSVSSFLQCSAAKGFRDSAVDAPEWCCPCCPSTFAEQKICT